MRAAAAINYCQGKLAGWQNKSSANKKHFFFGKGPNLIRANKSFTKFRQQQKLLVAIGTSAILKFWHVAVPVSCKKYYICKHCFAGTV